MEKLIFRNSKNETVELGDKTPFILKHITGAGGIETDVQMQKSPYQDGKTYIDSVINERLISLNVVLISESEEERFQLRHQILRVFNPKLGKGTLTYQHDGGEKEVEVVVKTSPTFKEDNELPEEQLETLIHLIAPLPFWLDTYVESKEIATWNGGFKFPLVLSSGFATKGSPEIVIKNEGDVKTPVIVEFSGPATNPKIENKTTNEFIKVNKSILAGEKLIVSTKFGNKIVEIEDSLGNRTNAFNWIDLNSTFFQLVPGTNVIKCDSDEGTNEAKISIQWRNRYIGI